MDSGSKVSPIVVFEAQEIVTLNHLMPTARYVAVKDGNILALAQHMDQMQDWLALYPYELNTTFKNKVFVPGFYEPHTHIHMLGYFWQYPYVGRFDRYNPEGKLIKGCTTKDEIYARIKQALIDQPDPEKVVVVWGYQPSFYDDERMGVAQLDAITKDRPVIVVDINLHEMYVNSAVLAKARVDAATADKGFVRIDGVLTGEVQEEAILTLYPFFPDASSEVLRKATSDVFKMARKVGVTTIIDAAFGLIPNGYQAIEDTLRDDHSMRVVVYPFINAVTSPDIVAKGGYAYVKQMQQKSSPFFTLGAIKIVIDGSLQAKTARLLWPYYLDGTNGVFNISYDELKDALVQAFTHELQVTMHANGDEAIEWAVQATEYALNKVPRVDHRTRIEHCQTPHMTHIKRMQKLGMDVSALANHIYYWGDVHWHKILGYNRAQAMHPLKTLLAHDISVSLHSDVVSPMNPLLAMWVAVNRVSIFGSTLGKDEALTPLQALKAVTIWPAYQQFQDHCKGSIEVGKYADFTILDANPLTVAHQAIKDINVCGTIVAGTVFPAE